MEALIQRMQNLMRCDFHLHTNHSDGSWSPQALVSHAAAIGMDVIAITDHDTVSGIAEAQEALQSQSKTVAIIPAVEINSIWNDGYGRVRDVHILGYYIDVNNAALHALFSRQRQARLEQVEEMIGKLQAGGIDVSMTLVQNLAGSSPIGKIHVTRAIVEAGGAGDVSEAYSKYYDRHSPFFTQRRSVSPEEAMQAIKDAGGIASIAHPGADSIAIDLIEDLREKGLDGIEVYHRTHGADEIRTLSDLAARLGMLETGGSDCHGPFQEHQSLMGTITLPESVADRLTAFGRN